MHDSQDNKVIWDGIPSPYFVENFYQPLQNSLGGVSENGHTLLVTAFDNDAGGFGPNAVPNYAIATAQIRAQHDNRVRRLFSCIMNYILAGCSIYIYLQRERERERCLYIYIYTYYILYIYIYIHVCAYNINNVGNEVFASLSK